MKEYQICKRCIMDTTDPRIIFNESGYCNHCVNFFDNIKNVHWLPSEIGNILLEKQLSKIKSEGKGKIYDGIIGLSGGVDSSYLLHKLCEWGIRPLVVHVDAGWNSEIAVKNIELLCKKLGVDLHTIVIDWDSIRRLQVAFLRAGVTNQDIPQDHAFFAALYRYAIKNNVRYVFHGSNYATESILPSAWGYSAMDSIYIKSIYRRFGEGKLKDYPTVTLWELYVYFRYVKRMQIIKPLNYVPYKKTDAMKLLEDIYGWTYYGAKHWESRFTKFFQGYYLPKRFGYDKRRAHLSSLVVSGEITRDEALKEMELPSYPPNIIDKDKAYIMKKLQITQEAFEEMLESPLIEDNYPKNEKQVQLLLKIAKQAKVFRAK